MRSHYCLEISDAVGNRSLNFFNFFNLMEKAYGLGLLMMTMSQHLSKAFLKFDLIS